MSLNNVLREARDTKNSILGTVLRQPFESSIFSGSNRPAGITHQISGLVTVLDIKKRLNLKGLPFGQVYLQKRQFLSFFKVASCLPTFFKVP